MKSKFLIRTSKSLQYPPLANHLDFIYLPFLSFLLSIPAVAIWGRGNTESKGEPLKKCA
jgi:hypothetical protein